MSVDLYAEKTIAGSRLVVVRVLGGESYFASRAIELAVIAVFAIASVWIIVKLVARAPARLPA